MAIMEDRYLYAIEHPDGYWKIGRSKDPYARVSNCQTGSPYQLEFKYAMKYHNFMLDPNAEDEAHERLEDSHVRGEWFDITEERVKEVFKNMVEEEEQEPLRFFDIKEGEERRSTDYLDRRAEL